jgi:hypothetical protein
MKNKIFILATFVSLITSIAITGCKNFNPKKDVLVFESKTVPFENSDPKRTKFEELDKIFQIACSKAKADCAHPLSFKPTSAKFTREGDETMITLNYQASNSYGVAGEVVGECKFKYNNFVDFKSKDKVY